MISLDGSDIATNFFRSLDMNAVVLRVDPQWEGFLEVHFKPWVHYVPIRRDLSDMEEKIDWCEANLDKCQTMIDAAHSVTLIAKSRILRRRALEEVIKQYEMSTNLTTSAK